MRKSIPVSSLESFKFINFRKGYKTDEEDFRKVVSELERFSCLPHDEDQFNHSLCTTLWYAVELCPWSLHAMRRYGEDHYSTDVESLTDAIQKFGIYGAGSNTYSNNHGRSAYATLELRKQTCDKDTKSSCKTDEDSKSFTGQRGFRIHRSSQRKGYKSHRKNGSANRFDMETNKNIIVLFLFNRYGPI